MDRRNFMRSVFAAAGAVALVAIPNRSEASSLLDELQAMEGANLDADALADLPADGAEEAQYRRCWWRVDRFGRRVRVCQRVAPRRRYVPPRRRRRCWIRYDRFGRAYRVCR